MPKAEAGPLTRRRILIVDDQPSILALLEIALSEAGAEVRSAADGPAALASLEPALPDLILLDLAMPAMDGWQVIDRLMASARTAAIPVVLQTSAVDFTSFDRARRRGVAAFISKPFRLNDVVETCRRILDGARPLQGRAAEPDDAPVVQVQDSQGNLLSTGRLLEQTERGAQAELERPLELAQRVVLAIQGPDGGKTLEAEVRWVTRAGERFQHGLIVH